MKKILHQQRNVDFPLPQRNEMDWDYIDPIVKIRPHFIFRHEFC